MVIFGGVRDVWELTDTGADPRKVIEGGVDATPAGARYDATHGVEVYMTTEHCLWRCRLRDGSVECIWRTPATGDEPPKVLRSD